MCMKNKLKDSFKQISNVATEKSKQLADSTKTGMYNLSSKLQDESYKALLKKYYPVFIEDYKSKSFSMPYMIVITTDAERKDVEVCEGAIGWRSSQKDMEVLHLYDTAVELSGLKFVPTPTKDTFYYVDDLDRSRYIKLDSYFDTMQEAMIAELANIAFSLGAKRYSIDLEEKTSEFMTDNRKANLKVKIPFSKDKQEINTSNENSSHIKKSTNIANKSNFSNGAAPEHPNLKIFKNNDLINGLIEMRMKSYMNNNEMGGYSIEIKKSSYTSINKNIASNIDAVVKKINVKAEVNMEQMRQKIAEQTLVYQIEF